MYQHPDLMLTAAHEHQRDLIADADRKRLFNRINRRRHGRARARSDQEPSRQVRLTPGAFAVRAHAVGALALRDLPVH
jgi:3-phenylpropionate/cinnamic acid dioxygenase small subunit